MKHLPKILRYLALVLIISNIPPVSEILSIFFYSAVGRSFDFISKDAHFYAHGGIQTIKANDKYLEYVKAMPKADHTLYRCFAKREWKYFFLWRIYLTDENWIIPYIDEPFFLSAYEGDYYLYFNPTPRPYQWNDHTQKWEKVAKKLNTAH